MRYIERSVPPPAILTAATAELHRKKAAEFMTRSQEQRSQQPFLRSSLNLSHLSMRDALHRLFANRCAFCETAVHTEPYRFRPVENALPHQVDAQAHLYYSWLDIAWQNIYSICDDCLPRESEYFPVFGKRAAVPELALFERYAEENTGLWPSYPLAEKPVLLDPCQDKDIHRYIGAQTNGRLVGLKPRGVVTIEHFSLNGVKGYKRALTYKHYFSQLLDWMSDHDGTTSSELFDFAELEFGGTWYLLLRRLAISIGAKNGTKPELAMSRIDRVFKQLRKNVAGRQILIDAWEQVDSQDLEEYSNDHITVTRRHSEARVTSVRISHFKSIEHLHVSLLPPTSGPGEDRERRTPALLILGENAAGKSSLLEAIALGLATDEAVTAMGLTPRNYVLDTSLLGAGKTRQVAHARIDIGFSDNSTRTRTLSPTAIHKALGSDEHVPVFAYGAFRQYQHKAHRRGGAQTTIRNLFDGSVLPNPEQWLLSLEPDRYAMVIRALSDILAIDGRFEVVRRDPARKQCFVVTALKQDGTPLVQSSLNAASSGFRSILAMVCDVMRGMMNRKVYPHFDNLQSARAVVLIDEVEAHLHPRWKMQIMRGLRQALPNVTFIATTHDPLCLRGMHDGETVVMRRVRVTDGTTSAGLPTRSELLDDLPSPSEMRLEQLLTSDLFQLHSTDDPEMDRQFAEVADLLGKPDLDVTQRATVERFKRDVVSALPIGTSEVHRMVQEAVADYLKQRRDQPSAQRKALRENVKTTIVNALRSVL
ncbi:MAG: AAA family ATPase [Pseudomonas putida]|jgi:hypothetical protein|nr:AAA family ATPase [Pseudomonas putida]